MSWKNTNPLDIWRTSTTLPIPNKNKEQFIFSEPVHGSVKTRFWASLYEMSPDRRTAFFREMLKIWPYKWERRGINWSINTIPLTVLSSSLYISTKITADVFLVEPHIGFVKSLRKVSNKAPTLLTPVAFSILAQMASYRALFKPYIENEGNLSKSLLFARASFIVIVFGICFPLLFVPSAANSIYNLEQQKRGMPANLQGGVLDLVLQTFEYSRSLWHKLPFIFAANLIVAGAAVTAIIWSRERIHSTIDIDPELIQTLIEEKEQKNGGRKSFFERLGDMRRTAINKIDQMYFANTASGKPLKGPNEWTDLKSSGILDRIFEGNPEIPIEEIERNVARKNMGN